MKKEPAKPGIWCATFGNFALRGRRRAKTIKLFTVAASRAQARTTMADGLMGLPGAEGCDIEPVGLFRAPQTTNLALYIHNLVGDGYQFIVPYRRLTTPQIVSLISDFMG